MTLPSEAVERDDAAFLRDWSRRVGIDSGTFERFNSIADLIASQQARIAALVEAGRKMLPSGVCLTNRNIPDDFKVALDTTMGELREFVALLNQEPSK